MLKTMQNITTYSKTLAELEALRGNPVILYHSAIEPDTIQILYECLLKGGSTPRLDLVLSTSGGTVTTAHRMALLLHEFTDHLTILVPYCASSAGTLLCLGANELILGSMAELGPIDPHIAAMGASPSDAPSAISAEDIRSFRQMARDWFGVDREKDRLQVLALITQRMFPTSLGAFYRAEQMARSAAHQLLQYQLPDNEASIREQIVSQLLGGFGVHSRAITRTEAKSLGLRVRFPAPNEEALLWNVAREVQREPPADQGLVLGMIASSMFCARKLQDRSKPMSQQGERAQVEVNEGAPLTRISRGRWQIENEQQL